MRVLTDHDCQDGLTKQQIVAEIKKTFSKISPNLPKSVGNSLKRLFKAGQIIKVGSHRYRLNIVDFDPENADEEKQIIVGNNLRVTRTIITYVDFGGC